jgi:carbon monoxide dehydrogenase subunit G
MPTGAEKITIPSPPDEVWPLLSDPTLVASCIPGATLAPDQDGGDVWKGSIRVKFGPTVAVFRGEATLTYDHTNRRCTIEGRGIDQRGASRALANGSVTASGTTETVLAVEGEYTVTGPLETFANAGGVHVARALLAEFAKNMGALVAERRSAAPASPTAAQPPTAALPPANGAPAAAAAENARVATNGGPARSPAPTQPSQPPRQAAELNAFALLWAAFKSWLSSLFGKRS